MAPTLTALAPARDKLMASSAVAIPPHTDNGDLYRLCHLIDHTDSDGFDGRAAHAAGLVGTANFSR